MQDYDNTPNKDSMPFPDQRNNRIKVIKLVALFAFIAVVTTSIFIYRDNQKNAIESAQAEILAQAVELNDIEKFSIYKGSGGGLYQDGSNLPSISQRVQTQKQIEQIRPLNKDGLVDSAGKIGFVYIGDPYTKGEMTVFSEFIKDKPDVNRYIEIVDGVEENFDTSFWNKSLFAWESLNEKTRSNSLSTKQVQLLWISLSQYQFSGDIKQDSESYSVTIENIITNALINFPNTRIIYVSSPRNARNSSLNNFIEPNSYETAFGVREIIRKQESQEIVFKNKIKSLNTEPVIIWGPYIWKDSFEGGSDFSYTIYNYEDDGITLTTIGKQRYAVDLYDFWRNYEFSKGWFLSN